MTVCWLLPHTRVPRLWPSYFLGDRDFRMNDVEIFIPTEGFQGYTAAGIRQAGGLRENSMAHQSFCSSPPMGCCGNPQLVRSIVDGCNWLSRLANYPLQKAMEGISAVSFRGGGNPFTLSTTTCPSTFPTRCTITTAHTSPARANVIFRHASTPGKKKLSKNS